MFAEIDAAALDQFFDKGGPDFPERFQIAQRLIEQRGESGDMRRGHACAGKRGIACAWLRRIIRSPGATTSGLFGWRDDPRLLKPVTLTGLVLLVAPTVITFFALPGHSIVPCAGP